MLDLPANNLESKMQDRILDATKDLENRMLKATLEMLNKQKMETLQQEVMAPMQDAEKWMPTVTMEQLINMKSEMQQ